MDSPLAPLAEIREKKPPHNKGEVKHTPELERKLLTAFRLGATTGMACKAAGISDQTLLNWYARTDIPELIGLEDRVEEARAAGPVAWLARIEKAAEDPKHWPAAAWKLERIYPGDFGRHDRLTMKGGGDMTNILIVNLGLKSEERRRKILEMMRNLDRAHELSAPIVEAGGNGNGHGPDAWKSVE